MLGDGILSTATLWKLTFEVSVLCQHRVQFLSSLFELFTDLFLQ